MTSASKLRKVELNLARRSQQLAEDQSRLVAPDRLAQAITEFIDWRALSYWLRLIVETEGRVSDSVIAILRGRCPGFLEYVTADSDPGEARSIWLRFLEWTDKTYFQAAIAQGWRHALGYYATRDPRMDQIRAYWKQCRRRWKLRPPASLQSFESWRESAFQHR